MIFFGTIKNFQLLFNDPDKLNQFIAKHNDKEMKIRFERYIKTRSNDQNKLYWAWINIISLDLGYDPEELHNSFRAMFLTDRSAKIPLVRSTTVLNTREFGIYLDKIQRKAAELNIVLPNPDEI